MTQNKFSEWMRVDLHIHSDWSRKTKHGDYQGNFIVENLKEKLKTNDVSIFSITDHNIINLPAYESYYSSYNPEEDPLLLLGIEFDVDVINQQGESKTYHSLLIFNYSDSENAKTINDKIEGFYENNEIDDFDRKLTIEDIVELFPEDDFFFIPHAGSTKSIRDSYKGKEEDAQMMLLLMQSALEKVKKKSEQIYNDGFDKLKSQDFRKKDDVAYVQFSDNHNADSYPCKGKKGNPHEFYYLKGSKSFETLRLAFIDPKSRIKSTPEYKKTRLQANYIERIKIDNDDLLESSEITFSPHLNVLIGGRSSGKSLLMTLLGKKIDGIDSANNIYNKNFSEAQIKSIVDADYRNETSISKEEITYLKQNEIVQFFQKNDLRELAKTSGKEGAYNLNRKLFNNHKKDLESRVGDAIEKYGAFDGGDFNRNFELLETTIQSLLSSSYTLKISFVQLKKKFDQSELIGDVELNLLDLKGNIAKFKSEKFLEWKYDELTIVKEFEKLILVKEILVAKKKLNHNRKLHFLTLINESIDRQNLLLDEEGRRKAKSHELKTNLELEIAKRFEKLSQLKLKTKKLGDFKYTKSEKISLTKGVELVMEVTSDSTIKDEVLEGIKGAFSLGSLYINLLSLLDQSKSQSIKNQSDVKSDNLNKKLTSILKGIYKSLDSPQDYLIYEDGNDSRKNSPGYNSEKYLQIILNNDKSKFVFIDQPEDNLGNKFIAETLVDEIRKIKFEKQIFLVTHNPSVVVYGDAENVIIANHDGQKISYSQHVIEDPSTQKEICAILDGGEYIFDMRSKKYNIQKLIKDKIDEEAS